jgi:hypothetical protein
MSTKHTRHDPAPDAVAVRDIEDDGRLYRLTAPISSTATARDGQAFSRDRLATFRDQINAESQPVPLMVDHGKSEVGGEARYSVLGRVGTVESAELEADGDTTLLRAEMAVADPDALADEGDAGEIEAALRYLKYQAETMGLSFSVGWNEESGRTSGPELLEVSAVAVPSDVTSSTAAAEPSEAAVRGFNALPRQERGTTRPDDWGFRGSEAFGTEPTDADRATDALDRIAEYIERNGRDAETRRRRGLDKHPIRATVEELRRQFGHDRSTVDVADRLDALRGTDRKNARERKDALARLRDIDAHRDECQGGSVHRDTRSDWGEEPVKEAVEELRDLLVNAPAPHAGRGFAGFDAPRTRVDGDAVAFVKELFDDLGRRSTSAAHRTLYDAVEPGRSDDRIRRNLRVIQRDAVTREEVLGAIEAIRENDPEDGETVARLKTTIIGGSFDDDRAVTTRQES